MLARLTTWTVMTLLLAAGCQSGSQTAAPVTAQQLQAIRRQMAATDGATVVGVVVAIEPSGRPFVAVGDVPVDRFRPGDTVNFIDSNRKPLTDGIVRRIVGDLVHVEWLPPTGQGRAPRVGDVVVHRPQPMRPLPAPRGPAPAVPATSAAPAMPAAPASEPSR